MAGNERPEDARGRTLTAPLPTDEEMMAAGTGKRPQLSRAAVRSLKIMGFLQRTYHALSLPITALFLLYNPRFHPSYGMTWRRKIALAFKMRRATRKVLTGTSYKAHLAMAAKLFEIPPQVKGAVVECGCWRGGSTACLSLVCDIVGRELIVYDSFEGLPPADPGDKYASPLGEGNLSVNLDTVKENVSRFGAIDRCSFRKGWFQDTLPHHTEPVVLAFLDVDYEASMYDCVLNLWPHLTGQGYMFMDEYTRIDYCAIFFSERFWREHFNAPPPGLMGAGTGVGVGQFYLGPEPRVWIQAPTSVAYTRKDFYGRWDYVRDEAPLEDR